MKISKYTALFLAAALAAAPAVGCQPKSSGSSSKTSSTTASTLPTVEDVTIVEAELNQEKEANDTVFTLNRVIDAGAQTPEGEHYYFLDVTIKNNTSTEYEISTLNNFFITLSDGSDHSSAINTQVYALNTFSDKYSGSPYKIPANGEFSSVIGGFRLPEITADFSVGFYPTLNDDTNKDNLIKVEVKASSIIPVPDDLKK